jgi:DNA-binding CsgD family transcriptional regulator
VLANLGAAWAEAGDAARGIVLLEEALALHRAAGHGHFASWVLARLGHVEYAAGDAKGAAARFSEALRLMWESGAATQTDRALVGIAALAADRGHVELAARLLGAIEAIHAQTGATEVRWPEVRERAERTARAVLGETAYAVAVATGRDLPLGDAVLDALALAGALAAGVEASMPVPAAATASEPRHLADRVGLSAREREVLALLAQRRSDAEIAEALYLSVRTVEGHVRGAFNKLGVNNRRDAAALAARHGLA